MTVIVWPSCPQCVRTTLWWWLSRILQRHAPNLFSRWTVAHYFRSNRTSVQYSKCIFDWLQKCISITFFTKIFPKRFEYYTKSITNILRTHFFRNSVGNILGNLMYLTHWVLTIFVFSNFCTTVMYKQKKKKSNKNWKKVFLYIRNIVLTTFEI